MTHVARPLALRKSCPFTETPGRKGFEKTTVFPNSQALPL